MRMLALQEIYPVAAVREIDRTAIEDEGIPGYTLMTRAGAAAVAEAKYRFPSATHWQIVCGAGNNAGDGYVVARLAAEEGIAVSVVAVVDPEALKGDARTAHDDFLENGGVVMLWSGDLDADADLVIDGLLGSGLERPVEGVFADAVDAINAHPAPTLALDIPTGLHGDTGEALGAAVRADLTVTFVGLKSGLFLGEGPTLAGTIVFAGLDIPAHCRDAVEAVFRRIDDDLLTEYLQPRPRAAHKGDFGHVLVVGGGPGMPGAVRLCGEAALRTGAGRVSLATDPAHAAMIVANRPELMSHGVQQARDLLPLLERVDVVAFGPGLGQSEWAKSIYGVIAESELPSVWDADALNLLSASPSKADNRVLTPHPGEAGALLGSTAGDVQADRLAALEALESRYGGTIVLKGAGSLVSAANAAPWLSTSGNPGMAAAGMGDVLTGVIAALMAQGLEPATAAAVGVEVHARAGDLAAEAGERGLIAGDLIAALRQVVNPL
ncbi:MAG: NAD(P)H-hydrate dehydratase [Woeseiaceae bacterium]|nr:NAD(P)H-hydrate dehydratase [Woeseiaceae bacterium]